MALKLMIDGCGCLWWAQIDPIILQGSYIAWDSTYNELISPYKPYVKHDDETVFYVPYNFDPMEPTPVKFLEIDDAPALTAMDYFIGVAGDGHDYKFTPAQLIAYILGQTRKTVVATDADTLTDSFITDGISAIGVGGQLFNAPFFTVVGSTVQPVPGLMSWAGGDTLTLFR